MIVFTLQGIPCLFVTTHTHWQHCIHSISCSRTLRLVGCRGWGSTHPNSDSWMTGKCVYWWWWRSFVLVITVLFLKLLFFWIFFPCLVCLAFLLHLFLLTLPAKLLLFFLIFYQPAAALSAYGSLLLMVLLQNCNTESANAILLPVLPFCNLW